MFISNYRASFHLQPKESLVKHQKASKYYATDCRNKSETNISENVCRDINKWLNNNNFCLLEAVRKERRALSVENKYRKWWNKT